MQKIIIVPSCSAPVTRLAIKMLVYLGEVFTRHTFCIQDQLSFDFVNKSKAYTSLEYARSRKQEDEILEHWEKMLHSLKFSSLAFNVSPEESRAVFFKAIVKYFDFKVIFISMCKKIYDEENKTFVLWAPLPLFFRNYFAEKGLSGCGVSALLWMVFCVESQFNALVRNFRAIAKILFGFIGAHFRFNLYSAEYSSPNIFFTGLTEHDVGLSQNGIGISRFINERVAPMLSLEFGIKGPFFLCYGSASKVDYYSKDNIFIGRNPFQIRSKDFWTIRRVGKLFWNQIKSIFNLFMLRWEDFFLLKEYADLPFLYEWFSFMKPKAILHSYEGFDPLWFCLRSVGNTKTFTFFYSTNNAVIEFEAPYQNCGAPYFHYMVSDVLCAWDEEHVAWLQRLGYPRNRILLFGPTVYLMGNKSKVVQEKTIKKVTAFEVIPFNRSSMLKIGYAEIYYTLENVKKFLEDVERACVQVFGENNFMIQIKPKRQVFKDNDMDYWKFIETKKQDRHFRVFHYRDSILEMIENGNSDFVISMPFSSPTNVAKSIGVHACFYDVTGNVLNKFLTKNNAPLVKGYSELVSFLERKPCDSEKSI